MIQEQAHELYDDPTKWGTFGIWEQPAFDVEGFQSRINAICGTSLGQPVVRLVWSWDKRCREAYYTAWDAFGNGTTLEWEYKYRVARIPIGGGDTVDICAPRWILEQRYEPGQYAPSWEQSRWAEQDMGKRHSCNKTDEQRAVEMCSCPDVRIRKELRPPAPRDGWYSLLWTIAEHEPDRACCARVYAENRKTCWGRYRLPSDADLTRLQRAVSLRDADAHRVDPHQPMSPEALAEAHRAAYAEDQRDQEARQQELDSLYRDYAVALGVEPTKRAPQWRLKNGQWSGDKQTRRTSSGLYLP